MAEPPRADRTPSPRPPPVRPIEPTASREGDVTAGPPVPGHPDPATVEFQAPGRLAHYRVLRELGRGGMGCVLLAEDTRLQRQVALKVMLPSLARDAGAKERFLREARAAARVRHDNVVTIFQVDECDGVPFIALEFLHGSPLDKYLKDKGTPPLSVAVRIARDMADGLAAAHQQGLVHRDVKPANVWLEAPKGRAKLLDFGLARAEGDDAHLTQSGAIVGTPAFMAPEQARGEKVDGRGDLFSLGVVLYRLATGRQPFAGASMTAVLTAIAVDTPAPPRSLNPNIPGSLETIILRLLEKDPANRYATAKEVSGELVRVLKELSRPSRGEGAAVPSSSTPAAPAATATASRPPRKRRPVVLVGLALGVVAVGIVALQTALRVPDETGTVPEREAKQDRPAEISERPEEKPPLESKLEAKAPPETKPAANPPAYEPVTLAEREAKKLQADWAARLKVDVETTSPTGIVMVLIPPGGPALAKPYRLGKFEVTQAEWERVMGNNPSVFKEGNKAVEGLDTSRFPVENVSWLYSVEFCNQLSGREGLKPYYELKGNRRLDTWISDAEAKILGGPGYHLPTDAEWEHGCRAGSTTKYYFGDNDKELPRYAWFANNSGGRPHAVGELMPNAFGLYDMHGNVREWNEETVISDKTGLPARVSRGGFWGITADNCTVSHRHRPGPTYHYSLNGLRVARAVSDDARARK